MQICIPNAWNPRPYQRRLWDYFAKGGRRAVAVWHRRCGKDSLALNLEAAKALTERVGVYWHMLPLNTQARKVIWDGVDRYGRRMIDQAFPKELRLSTNDQEMKIVFKNGSVWQCVGSDNYDALVGSNPVGVVFSEYSVTPKAAIAWDYIRPILAENGGWALFIYTPRGHNHGYTLYNQAKAAGWFTELLTVDDTKAIPAEAVEEERRAGMSEAMIQQEFYCSFEAVNDEELKLISFDLIAPALDREITEKPDMPLVIGVDPARFGDDKTAIARRRGRSVFKLERFTKKSVTEVANIVASIIRLEKPARVFIDAGGLGAGVGLGRRFRLGEHLRLRRGHRLRLRRRLRRGGELGHGRGVRRRRRRKRRRSCRFRRGLGSGALRPGAGTGDLSGRKGRTRPPGQRCVGDRCFRLGHLRRRRRCGLWLGRCRLRLGRRGLRLRRRHQLGAALGTESLLIGRNFRIADGTVFHSQINPFLV